MLPAHQSLYSNDPATGQIDAWLVVHDQAVGSQGAAQALLDLHALVGPLRHVLGVEMRAVAPLGFGRVHRHVGGAHQFLTIGAVVRIHRDSDTAGDGKRLAGNGDGDAQLVQDFIGQ